MSLILQIFPNVKTLIILECHFNASKAIDYINLSKILQRTLLRGGDCNLGWSWKKISLQCPELGLWTIPGETGLRESDRQKLTLPDLEHQHCQHCTVFIITRPHSFEIIILEDKTKEAFYVLHPTCFNVQFQHPILCPSV